MTNCYHKKEQCPSKVGTYWVNNLEPRLNRIGQVEMYHTDSGYAHWDGERWDREDWDCWYFEEKVSSFPTGSFLCSS